MWESDPFGERERPALSPDAFATLVASRIRAVPSLQLESQRGLELRLVADGSARRLNLEDRYLRYSSTPGQLEEIIDEAIASLRSDANSDREPDPFAELAVALRPLLITRSGWEEKLKLGLDPVLRPLLSDLGIVLVVDRPGEVQYVEGRALEEWRIGATLAFDLAFRNLEESSRRAQTLERGNGLEKLLIDREPDGYAAARVALRTRLEDWAGRVDGELAIGLPTRNMMVGLSRDHPALAEVRAQIGRDAAEMTDGLYPGLLVYRRGELGHLIN